MLSQCEIKMSLLNMNMYYIVDKNQMLALSNKISLNIIPEKHSILDYL